MGEWFLWETISWNNAGAKVELSFKGVIHNSTVMIQFSACGAYRKGRL